jgi:hypothetical protein
MRGRPYRYLGNQRYRMESSLVVEEALGRRLRPDEQVIHKNGDLFDTALSNLVVQRRHGRVPRSDEEFRQWFWARVEKTDTCWLWRGPLTDRGYGEINVCHSSGPSRQKTARVHRLTYEWAAGPIQQGLTIDHLCRVRNCVNPEHLEAVTQGENTSRGERRRQRTLRRPTALKIIPTTR